MVHNRPQILIRPNVRVGVIFGLRRARLRGPLYPHEPTCSGGPQSKYAASAPSLAASAGLALPRSREGKSRAGDPAPAATPPFDHSRDGNRCVSPASSCISKTVSSFLRNSLSGFPFPLSVDAVEKFFSPTGGSHAGQREGPHRIAAKRSQTFLHALQRLAATETSKT